VLDGLVATEGLLLMVIAEEATALVDEQLAE